MAKIIRLTESDLTKLVRRVIKEQSTVVPKLEEFVGKTAKFVSDDKSKMNPFKIVRTNSNSQQNQKAVFDVEIIDAKGETVKPATIALMCSTKKWSMYSQGDTQETFGFSPKLGQAVATKWCVPETIQTDY
jgi:hypothetical protein